MGTAKRSLPEGGLYGDRWEQGADVTRHDVCFRRRCGIRSLSESQLWFCQCMTVQEDKQGRHIQLRQTRHRPKAWTYACHCRSRSSLCLGSVEEECGAYPVWLGREGCRVSSEGVDLRSLRAGVGDRLSAEANTV